MGFWGIDHGGRAVPTTQEAAVERLSQLGHYVSEGGGLVARDFLPNGWQVSTTFRPVGQDARRFVTVLTSPDGSQTEWQAVTLDAARGLHAACVDKARQHVRRVLVTDDRPL